jgi:membrane protein implicated in regulation of membrane protease activity
MSNCPLCNLEPAPKASAPKQPIGIFRRAWRSIQWLFPAALFALIPKCPLCVMAYVALFTGVGISVSTARWIQILMFVVCFSSLAYLVARKVKRMARANLTR